MREPDTVQSAAQAAVPTDKLAEAIRCGAYGIDGWQLWTWDTNEQPDLWSAIRDRG